MSQNEQPASSPTLLDALLPILFLVLALVASVRFFGEDSSYGPNQIALMLTGVLVLVIGLINGMAWRELEGKVYSGMGIVFGPSFILLSVGLMVAAWIAAGIVPTLIYYGLLLISPSWFYAAACLVCAIVSLSIGSSWTTAASVGVALIGTALGLGLSPALTAGAVISGAYFGDKMSPLSDTTNLAPAVVEADLFEHIRHMCWTGIPSLVIALVLFLGIGLVSGRQAEASTMNETVTFLREAYNIGWYLLLPLAVLFVLAWKRMPALPALLIASMLGFLFAVLFQPQVFSEEESVLSQIWMMAVSGYESSTGNTVLDDLLSGGGAANMLNTIWLILSAVFFGCAMEATGLLGKLLDSVLSLVRSTASLIFATVATAIGTNIVAGDQYIAIVVPGRMYQGAYKDRGLAPLNLSRALEDSATVTSALVPWNTCGAFMAATLGVATFDYLPYCFFNLVMPVISIAYGITNFRVLPLQQEPALSSST